ncbi:MAG TPA: hypothetical protein VGH20_14660 [Myxococcales bacterium]|jgi:hypothetical protein
MPSCNRRVSIIGVAIASLFAVAPAAHAFSNQTPPVTITAVNLDGDNRVSGGGVCITTSASFTQPWFCLVNTNPLYRELTSLILLASTKGSTCTIYYNPGTGVNGSEIRAMTCAP